MTCPSDVDKHVPVAPRLRHLDAAVRDYELSLIDTCGVAPAPPLYCLAEARALLAVKLGHGPVKVAAFTPHNIRALMATP